MKLGGAVLLVEDHDMVAMKGLGPSKLPGMAMPKGRLYFGIELDVPPDIEVS